jgi:hypothetical protein
MRTNICEMLFGIKKLIEHQRHQLLTELQYVNICCIPSRKWKGLLYETAEYIRAFSIPSQPY